MLLFHGKSSFAIMLLGSALSVVGRTRAFSHLTTIPRRRGMPLQPKTTLSSSITTAAAARAKSYKQPITTLTTTRSYGIKSNPVLFAKLEEEVDPGKVDGTDLRIVKYPHPALRKPNEEISKEELKDGSISQLAKEMFMYMYEAEGVGLAAPQVGVNKRLMVYNQSGDKKRWLDEIVMVNPQIIEFSEGKDIAEEGCLSFPEMSGDVERSKWIKVEALNLKGKKIKRKFTGWEARIFQHEYDHLDGVVYIDRLSEKGKEEVQPRLKELIDEFGEGGAL